MIGFHVPSFTIDSGDVLEGQVGIAGHQIQNTNTAIFVCEDLLEEQQREIDTFQIDFLSGVRFECQTVDTYPLTVAFGLLTQGYFAIGFEWHYEVLLQFMLDKHHIVRCAVPDIAQDVLERNLVAADRAEQLAVRLVLSDGRASFLFAGLFIGVVFRFRHDAEPDWQRVAASMIQTCHEIDAFDTAILAMVIVPTDNFILVGIRLFSDAIVNDDYPVVLLNLSHIGLNYPPQIGGTKLFLAQQPLYLVMADAASQQASQPCSRRLSKGANQVFAIDVQQFVFVHPISWTLNILII